jgi:ERCC4-type nuclease
MAFNIIQDTREKSPLKFPSDISYSRILQKKLDTGDYAVEGLENLCAIDRKGSVNELATNLHEDRFPDVIERISRCKYKFLILEFSLDDVLQYPVGSDVPRRLWSKIKISGKYILKCLTEFQIKYGINIVFCGDTSNAALYVLSILKRIEENEKTKS